MATRPNKAQITQTRPLDLAIIGDCCLLMGAKPLSLAICWPMLASGSRLLTETIVSCARAGLLLAERLACCFTPSSVFGLSPAPCAGPAAPLAAACLPAAAALALDSATTGGLPGQVRCLPPLAAGCNCDGCGLFGSRPAPGSPGLRTQATDMLGTREVMSKPCWMWWCRGSTCPPSGARQWSIIPSAVSANATASPLCTVSPMLTTNCSNVTPASHFTGWQFASEERRARGWPDGWIMATTPSGTFSLMSSLGPSGCLATTWPLAGAVHVCDVPPCGQVSDMGSPCFTWSPTSTNHSTTTPVPQFTFT
mmetsp:Transcript_76881/g.248809  ORF Transcript_76881/g.248809 Transcript_76881/m.248809 type:complete len:309 (+) Transcript_76881:228-1154(+)